MNKVYFQISCLSTLSWIQFPECRIHRLLGCVAPSFSLIIFLLFLLLNLHLHRRGNYEQHVGGGTFVYMAAVTEYLAAEILKNSEILKLGSFPFLLIQAAFHSSENCSRARGRSYEVEISVRLFSFPRRLKLMYDRFPSNGLPRKSYYVAINVI